jgi:Protein kinase domain
MTATIKAGSHQWEVIRDLSGQHGTRKRWIVARAGPTEPLELTMRALRRVLSRATTPQEDHEKSRAELLKVMLGFAEHKYSFGALKQLKDPDEQSTKRLRTEVSVYEAISDPHLITILDKNFAHGENWIVTEYQPNGTLDNRLAEFKSDAVGALKAIRPLVNVLALLHAHSEKFIHRDFKPGNIFIGPREQLILGDAGLAFSNNAAGSRATQKFESVGTQHYMPAWAQARRLEDINPRFDVPPVDAIKTGSEVQVVLRWYLSDRNSWIRWKRWHAMPSVRCMWTLRILH